MSTNSPQSPLDLEALTRLANQYFQGLSPDQAPVRAEEGPLSADGSLHAPAAGPSGGASVGAFEQPAFGVKPLDVPQAAALPDPGAGGGSTAALSLGSQTLPVSPLSASAGQVPALDEVDPSQFGLPSSEALRALLAVPLVSGQEGLVSPFFSPGLAGALPYQFLEYAPSRLSSGPQDAAQRTAGQPAFRPAFDLHKVRRDFPILSERVNGRELVWLDNAATTQKPQAVIDRLAYFYAHENSNVHRGAHPLAARATDAYEAAREKTRGFLGAGSAEEIVFVRGATEAINLVAQSWGRANIGPGDEIVLTHLEHHANIVPWQRLAQEKGAVLKVLPVDGDGQVILAALRDVVGPRTKLLAFTHVSNALGTITPVKALIDAAHAVGALALVDGAQAVSHQSVNVRALDADFYVFSGHKVFGPTGIGVLYGKKELLNAMPPWQGGGNMIKDVTFERSQFHEAPGRFEAGTGNIADAIGLGAALDYVRQIGLEAISAYEHQLLLYATRYLSRIPGLRLVGTAPDKAGVLSFVLDGIKTEDVGAALGREGIAVRSGHHCAQPILRRFGLEATVRPSLAFYNHCADIDALVGAVQKIRSGGRFEGR